MTSPPPPWRDLKRWLCTLPALAHLVAIADSGTLRGEHLLVDGAFILMPWLGARDIAASAMPLWASGAIMDGQRFILFLRREVHTGDMWEAERRVFGRVWAEFFTFNHNAIFDAFTGFAYATHVPVFMVTAFSIALFKELRAFEQLCWGFLLVSLGGVICYMLFPVAPPWYIMVHGMGPADLSAAGSAASAARLDTMFNTTFFAQFYARTPNVFGAMPSLHVAYPALLVFATSGGVRVMAIAYTASVAFAAVYLCHHYLLDVLGGVALATAASALVVLPTTAPEPAYD